MNVIDVKNLNRDFEYYEKETGIRGSVNNLIKRNKKIRQAVKDISFEIEQGEIIGFLGPNGAGKTTTLKMLSGILYPTSGTATVDGYIPWERKNEFKRNFTYFAGQKSQLWNDLPASESLYLNKCLYEIDNQAYTRTVNELAELFDVKHLLKVQVRRLSLGERMKMELIAALLHKPKIVFLDEPTIGLDIIAQKTIREFLKVYNKETKTTMILTSHYMRDIEHLCNRAIIINEGEKVYDGAIDNLRNLYNTNKLLILTFENAVAREQISAYGNVIDISEGKATIEISKERFAEASHKILNELPIIDFAVEEMPIEQSVALLYNVKRSHYDERISEV